MAEAAIAARARAGPWPRIEAALLAQRGHLLPWAPVAMGTGIGVYFALPREPTAAGWLAVALAAGAALLGARRVPLALAPLLLGVALAAGGAGLAGWRTWATAAPVLGFRYHGPVEGRIVEVDRSASDALRLTLDRVALEDVAPDRTPARVRVSVRGDQRWLRPDPGRVVMLTAHLAPPGGPSEPGDFDFRRTAWFQGLGAVGWTETPVLTAEAPQGGLWLTQLRARLSAAVRARIGGDAGGLAAAVTTGDRSGLSPGATAALRDSGLYHIVSISGMHMGLVVGFVFGLVRGAIAMVPPLALRVPGKKVAALVALPVAAFYLALAGRDVATERAFVMVAAMLGAVLLDRRAVTLRSVGIAALAVLALRPESLLDPGFQMSFAAVAALTAAFERAPGRGLAGRWRLVAPALGLALSSLVAGVATAPFAGAHFNRVATYSLLANLLAAPAMGLLVMPGAVLLALGAPLGLDEPARLMVDLGCRWVLLVGEAVAGLDGATGALPTPPGATLPLLAYGGVLALLWRGRGRALGAALAVAGLAIWPLAPRPDLLVAASGGVMGVLGPEGRALSRATGDAYAVAAWLENDGDAATQADAADRPGVEGEGRDRRAVAGGVAVRLVRGSRALGALEGCGGAAILVTDQEAGPGRPCLVLDARLLAASGAVAGWATPGGLRLAGAEAAAGERPWTAAGRRGAPPDLPTLAPGPLPP